MIELTEGQWRMLEILDRWGGHGTCEVECQWGRYDFGVGEAADRRDFSTTRLVCVNLVRSLVKRGYATINATDSCGYDITDLGREVLARSKNG